MGGLSSSYYHEELIKYPFVDFVIRGDSTEEPCRQLLHAIRNGEPLDSVENLTWKRPSGEVVVNPLTFIPSNLDYIDVPGLPVRDKADVQVQEHGGHLSVPSLAPAPDDDASQLARLHPGLLDLRGVAVRLREGLRTLVARLQVAREAGLRHQVDHVASPAAR